MGLKVCIFNVFPGDADAADPGTILWEYTIFTAVKKYKCSGH